MNEVLEQARSGEVAPLPGTSRGIPLSVRIRNIARKALAPCPDDRYQTVQDLQREVESFLHGGLLFPIVVFAAGERILTEGEPGDTAFVIVKREGHGVADLQEHAQHIVGGIGGRREPCAAAIQSASVRPRTMRMVK